MAPLSFLYDTTAITKKTELMSSARPTTPVTASVCTGCTANSTDAIWATDLNGRRFRG